LHSFVVWQGDEAKPFCFSHVTHDEYTTFCCDAALYWLQPTRALSKVRRKKETLKPALSA
jgi:hypothetical protein